VEAANPAQAACGSSNKAPKSKEKETSEEAIDEFNKQWSKHYGIEKGRIFPAQTVRGDDRIPICVDGGRSS